MGEILDAAIKVYLRNARVLMGLTAIVVVPLQILSAIVLLSTVSSGSDVPVGFTSIGQSGAQASARLGASLVIDVTAMIAVTLTTAACVRAVSDAYLGGTPAVGSSLTFALRRVLPLLAMYVLLLIGVLLGFIALIIPGIFLYGAWSVSTQALLIEGAGPVRSLGRSFALVRGRWWPAAGVLIVAFVMAAVISGVLEALLAAIGLSSHPSLVLATIVVSVSGAIATIITRPFEAAVATVLYYDLRVRKEGFDLELLAEQLGLPAVATPAGWVPDDGRRWGDPAGGPLAPGEEIGPDSVGRPGGPPFWPPPPGWRPSSE